MPTQYDEKGKIYTDVVSKIAVHSIIQTTTHMLRGQLHIRRDQRVKDELNEEESFLALTEVSVLGPDGSILFDAPFLAVRRSHIVWVIPDGHAGEESNS